MAQSPNLQSPPPRIKNYFDPSSIVGEERAPLTLDPIRRRRFAEAVKWGMLIAFLVFLIWLPIWARQSKETRLSELLYVTSAAIYAAMVATGLPRFFPTRFFQPYRRAVDAARDWIVVGVVTGILYIAIILVLRTMNSPWGFAPTDGDWQQKRPLLLFISGMVGILVGKLLAINAEGLSGNGPLIIGIQILIQGCLLTVLAKWIHNALQYATIYATQAQMQQLLLGWMVPGLLFVVTLIWAGFLDIRMKRFHPDDTGAMLGNSAFVPLSIAIIGGPQSGKSVLLAGAYYEWMTTRSDQTHILQIRPLTEGSQPSQGNSEIEKVVRDLYETHPYRFPLGDVECKKLSFEVVVNDRTVATISFLDYPGGLLTGQSIPAHIGEEFWTHLKKADGLVLIADMSYARREMREPGFINLPSVTQDVMRQLAETNGTTRILPVALVYTKCDEYFDPRTREFNRDLYTDRIQQYEYDKLKTQWESYTAEKHQKFTQFSSWPSSAVLHTVPRTLTNGLPDDTQPFVIAQTPAPEPWNCAGPLMWITAKIMRYNISLFHDLLRTMVGGSSDMDLAVEMLEKAAAQSVRRANDQARRHKQQTDFAKVAPRPSSEEPSRGENSAPSSEEPRRQQNRP